MLALRFLILDPRARQAIWCDSRGLTPGRIGLPSRSAELHVEDKAMQNRPKLLEKSVEGVVGWPEVIAFIRKVVAHYRVSFEKGEELIQISCMRLICKRTRRLSPCVVRNGEINTGYIGRTVLSAVSDYYRGDRHHKFVSNCHYLEGGKLFSVLEDEECYLAAPEKDTVEFDDIAAIKKVIDSLSDAHRSALLLFGYGFGYSEIAAVTGVPVGTVRSRISWGRKILSQQISLADVTTAH